MCLCWLGYVYYVIDNCHVLVYMMYLQDLLRMKVISAQPRVLVLAYTTVLFFTNQRPGFCPDKTYITLTTAWLDIARLNAHVT